MSLEPGTSLNHYRITGSLGAGGMGEVYRAQDLHLDRAVAIKLISPEVTAEEEIAARFELEARLLAALNHPNVATLYSVDRCDSVRFLVMELVEGVTLDARLREGGLSVVESLEVAEQVAQALEAAHESNIVHRDLKPANVMLTPHGRVKLVDFGIAKRVRPGSGEDGVTRASDLTAKGHMIGTAAYMSPEQVRGQPVDPRTDIWAFGCLLYEMLSGRRLFGRETVADTLAAILEHDADLDRLPAECAGPMEPLLRRCLQRDARRRARDIWHLRLEIEEVLRSGRESGSSVLCARCGQRNPSTNEFCNHCGAAQQAQCPSCGAPAPPGAAFCGGCGTALSSSPTAGSEPVRPAASETVEMPPPAHPVPPEPPHQDPVTAIDDGAMREPTTTGGTLSDTGERRHATVISLRLAGYHDLVEQVGPLRLEVLVGDFESAIDEVVASLGGTVQEIGEGTGVLIFGVPRAGEDDAQRAVRTALQIGERLRSATDRSGLPKGFEPDLVAGICTGAVVVRADTGRDQETVVAGRCHAMAEQLAAHALGLGGVLVSSATARLIGPHFDIEQLPPLTFVGHERASSPYRVLGEADVADRIITRVTGGLTTHVGREAELEAMRQGLRDAIEGNGQLISVVGEAGLGKSRLLYEFAGGIDRAAVSVLVGRCQSHGVNAPYLPFIEVLTALLAGGEGGEAELTDRAVAAAVIAIDSGLEEYVPLFLHLLSIESDDYPLRADMEGNLRFGILQGLTALLTEASRRQPLVLLLEDWQWSDEGSHDVLRQLASMAVGFPLLLVMAFRPEHEPDWARSTHHTPLHLMPLSADDSAAVMCAVLEAQSIGAELAERIHARASGNPFFVEELCRTLLESDALRVASGQVVVAGSIEALELPETIQAVLRTRFDQLDADAQEILRLGSVIGREFSGRLIESVFAQDVSHLERGLETLQQLGLVRQTRVVPEPSYRFRQILVREVAYDTLLEHQRKSLHGLVGAKIEELYPNHLEEQLDLLGEHFGAAEVWDKAFDYSDRASRRAERMGQFVDAAALLTRADGWLGKMSEDLEANAKRIDLLMRLERINEALGRKSAQQTCIDRLLQLLDPEVPSGELADVYVRHGELLTLMHRYEPAEEVIEHALRIADSLADSVLRRKALRSLAFLRWQQGRAQDSIDLTEQAIEIDRERDEAESMALDLANMAASLKNLGQFDRALELLHEALSLYESAGLVARQIEPLHIAATIFRTTGDDERAIEYLERARELVLQQHSNVQLFWSLTQLGNVYIARGDAERGLAYLQEGIEMGRISGYAQGLSQTLRAMGMGLLSLGRADEAVPYLQETAEMFRDLEEPQNEVVVWGDIATAYEKLGQTTDAVVAREQAVRLRRHTGDEEGELEALLALAQTSRAQEPDLAVSALQDGVALGRRLERLDVVGDALNTLGIIAWSSGNAEEAVAKYEAALEVFDGLQDDPHRGLILNSLGVVLKDLQRVEEAESRLREALEVNRAAGERLLEGHSLASLGDLALEREAAADALSHFQASLDIRRVIGDRLGEGWMLHRAARAAGAAGDAEAAAEYALQAQEVAEAMGEETLQSACQELQASLQ